MLLVGSRALKLRAPRILGREPNDFDFVCTRDEYESWRKTNDVGTREVQERGNKIALIGDTICEFEIVEPTNPILELGARDGWSTPFGIVPTLDFLFTLKASHRYLKNSPHFWKTAVDYHRMKAAGAKIVDKDWLKAREKLTYNYAHPSLNQSKKDFFADDAIKYVYDHDSIHRAVAMGERPAYTYFMVDGEEVKCDKAKFFALPYDMQMNSVLEEPAVLAIERSLVPHPGVWTPQKAWHFALAKVCSSITSGWWREFAYDNIFEAIKRYPANYYERFLAGVESGEVIKLL